MEENGAVKVRYIIIILTWNSANYINQCLTSIDEIRQFKVKIYVVDNGSTDETQRLLKTGKRRFIELN